MRFAREGRLVTGKMISLCGVRPFLLPQIPAVSVHGDCRFSFKLPSTGASAGLQTRSHEACLSSPFVKEGCRRLRGELPMKLQAANPPLISGRQSGVARCATATAPASSAAQSAERPNEFYKWPHVSRPRICILGGGFGGLYTALQLESLVWPAGTRPQILLVDQADRFVFKPLLYELLTNEVDQWEIAPRFSDLLAGTDVEYVRDTVTAVNDSGVGGSGPNSKVVLGSGTEVAYDWLVLSLGAEVNKEMVPGAAELAQAFSTLEDALETQNKLSALERQWTEMGLGGDGRDGITVAVVGAGYSGVELAATVAQRLGSKGRVQVPLLPPPFNAHVAACDRWRGGQIIDPSPTICASAPAGNRDTATKVLRDRKVDLLLNYRVESLERRTGKVPGAVINLSSSTGGAESKTEADLVLWTIGNRAAVPPREAGIGRGEGGAESSFPTSGRGQADTESSLRVKGHPNVFALGDSAAVSDASGKLLAGTAQVAFQQADYVGWNLWASINNLPLLPFRYQHLGEMMTLGGSDAAVTLGFVEGVTLDGPLAQAARKLAYLYRLPTNEHKAKVGLSWLLKSTADAMAFVQANLGTTTAKR